MSNKLEIRAFFFNAKTDYLPYYKIFNITMEDKATAKELLIEIQALNENFSFPEQKLIMKINGLVVEAQQSIVSLVEKLGTNLQIDPVSTYRSNNGLIINDTDFMQSFDLLAPYASPQNLHEYKNMYALHYASESSNFNRAYIGDAVLVLAHQMIIQNPENKDDILKAITSVHSGLMDCEYENNLFNTQDHTETIEALKKLVNVQEGLSLCALIMSRFRGKEKVNKEVTIPMKDSVTIENLKDKTVAHYTGLSSDTKMHSLALDSNITEVYFSRANKLSGLSLLKTNKELAFKKAAATLLEAFDAGAEVLVIDDIHTLNMFKKNLKTIEKNIGRQMIGFELISYENYILQTSSL